MSDSPNFDAMIAEANQIGVMAIRFGAKVDAMAQDWAARGGRSESPVQERDPLEPVREAMRQYDAAMADGQHGRIAAAHFADAIYAALEPASERVVQVVAVAEPETVGEPPEPQWDASSDAAQWCG